MKFGRWIVAAVAALCVSGASVPATSVAQQAQAPRAPTVEELAASPRMTSFAISPDGRHMAAVEARGEENVILVWDTSNLSAAPTVIGSREMKIQAVTFVKDDILGVTLWQTYDFRGDPEIVRTFVTKFFLTDLEGNDWREPLPLPRARTTAEQSAQSRTSPTIISALPNDPDHILLVNNVGSRSGDVYRVNVRANRATRVIRYEEGVTSYQIDLTGDIRSRQRIDRDSNGLFTAIEIRDPGTDSWSEHFRSYVRDRNVTSIASFTADPNIAYVLTNVGRDRSAIFEYNISTRTMGEVVFEHRFFEATGALVTSAQGPNFGEVRGFTYAGPRGNDVEWVSSRMRGIDEAIRGALGMQSTPITFVDTATGVSANTTYNQGLTYTLGSGSRDGNLQIVTVQGADQPPVTFLLRDRTQMQILSPTYPQLDAAALGNTRFMYYEARDGLMIPAYLTTPNEALCGAGPWPAVVHPHGGPWARDDMLFDGSMWTPLMASRCYAVLRPQFRGSEGWGRRLWTAGDAEWGETMQDDKDDGAQWMIDNGIARPGHIAMFGFSYGGYSAMAAAVRPHGLYRCAIAGAGVSDINRIWADFYLNPFFRDNQADTVDGLNPLDHADRIQIPIMVYHGVRDQIVPIEQSEWFVAAARRSGQPVVYHEFDDYGHGPAWTREIMADQLRVIDDYLRDGCGPGGLDGR